MSELRKHEEQMAPKSLKDWIEHYDFINQMRWGDDDKPAPTWEEVRDKHLSDWRNKNMSWEFWDAYVTATIIDGARKLVSSKPK